MRKFFSCVCLTVLLSLPVIAGEIPIGANPSPTPPPGQPPACATCSSSTSETDPGEIPIGAVLVQIIVEVVWP